MCYVQCIEFNYLDLKTEKYYTQAMWTNWFVPTSGQKWKTVRGRVRKDSMSLL